MKILELLIVDDDKKLRELLKKFLQEHTFNVTAVMHCKAAEQAMQSNDFDIMVLDMMMPGENGLDFCKRLRSNDNNIPIIMLSAQGDDVDKIIGLELGLDDYLSKPFNPRELLARIKAILRRPALQTQSSGKSHQIGEFLFNLSKRQLQKDTKQPIKLTSMEYDLLKIMLKNPNRPLSREQLMRLLHARDFDIFDRSIDVAISRLRKIIEKNPAKPEIIQTVWGVGYQFCQ